MESLNSFMYSESMESSESMDSEDSSEVSPDFSSSSSTAAIGIARLPNISPNIPRYPISLQGLLQSQCLGLLMLGKRGSFSQYRIHCIVICDLYGILSEYAVVRSF